MTAPRITQDDSKPEIVVLGMMTKMPVAGVVWQTLHYLVGLERLGYRAFYVETHARTPSMLMERETDDGSLRAAGFIARVMREVGMSDRWGFVALHDDGRCYGLSERRLDALYSSAELLINLHGGTQPVAEVVASDRLVYLETDPVQLQVELLDDDQATVDFLEPHCAFFTFAENLGADDCGLPADPRFEFHPTRQPVVLDLWDATGVAPGDAFTTIGNWRQPWREVTFGGETYSWSKHFEFLKFLELPSRTDRALELTLSSYEPADRALLERAGWRVREGLEVSRDPDVYRDYVRGSRGEFTVAKDQNVRLRTGWFSDRSATYLAAGRPVITQETGFSNILPTGDGLLAFSSFDEALGAVETIDSDYRRHCAAARDIAAEHFDAERVLGALLETVGVCRAKELPRRGLLPDADLESGSRHPARLEPSDGAAWGSRLSAASRRQGDSTPVTSIVVPTRDNVGALRVCLESVLSDRESPAYEVIVVDDASRDETPTYLAESAASVANVRRLTTGGGRGFAGAVNAGLRLARGDTLVILGDDTIVSPGWLARLVRHVRHCDIGLAGDRRPHASAAGGDGARYVTYGGFLRFSRIVGLSPDEVADVAAVSLSCAALRRGTLDRLGALDESAASPLAASAAYAERVTDIGLRLVAVDHVVVHRLGRPSFSEPLTVADGQLGESDS